MIMLLMTKFINNYRRQMVLRQFVLAFFIFEVIGSSFYNKIIHNTDPEARCLDGSQPAIYLHEGGDNSRILIYFIGGGACIGNTIQDSTQACYRRSKTKYGTSLTWPELYQSKNGGIMDTDPTLSRFANWTKIIILYCDGAFHQGYRKNPVQYKGIQLFFRGAVNTRSHIKWIDSQYNLEKAKKIVFSGSSAGGIAVAVWLNYVKSLVSQPLKVDGIVQSGIFLDPTVTINSLSANSSQKSAQTSNTAYGLFLLANADQLPPNKQCVALLPQSQAWKCLHIQISYPFLTKPVLFIESSYDSYMFSNLLGITCLKDGGSGLTLSNCNKSQILIMQRYRLFYMTAFIPAIIKAGHNIWSISCSWHASLYNGTLYDSDKQRIPQKVGINIRGAVQNFVFDDMRILSVDNEGWPLNQPCAY